MIPAAILLVVLLAGLGVGVVWFVSKQEQQDAKNKAFTKALDAVDADLNDVRRRLAALERVP